MNKRNLLLKIRPTFVVLIRHIVCVWFLFSLLAHSDGASEPFTAGNGTNQPIAASVDHGTNQATDLTQMSLEQLMQVQIPEVESASKFEQKVTQAPAEAMVITSDEIKKYGWRTLGELLATVPGFYVFYDRDYDYVGVSGVNLGDANNRILVMVNGHRINNDLNDSAAVDTSFILDVDLIDRVEIIRGPGSVLYGNNAFFAVINVITRQGKQINGVEGSGTYGSYDEASGRVTVGGQFTNTLQFLLSGTIYNSEGVENLFYPQYQAYNNGTAHNMDAGDFQSFFGSVSFRDFSLEGAYINRAKVNPTAQFDTSFNDPRLKTVDDRSYAVLKYEHVFPGDWDVSADAYYDRSDFQIGFPISPGAFPPGAPATVFDQEQQTGQWTGTEVQVNKKIFDKDTLTFGGEYRNDFEMNAVVFSTNVTLESVQATRQSYGIFGQGDIAVMDNLHVEAGVRYDEYGSYTPSWSPRAALIYNPWKQSTFKAIYGTAFRDPNILESELSGSTSLQPEKIESYQLVYEQGINRYFRSSVSGYYNRLNDLIGQNSSGAFANFNADTLGMDIALEGKWKYGINIRASYSLQRTVDRDTDASLPRSPENMIKLNINAPLYRNKIFAGLEVLYTGQSGTVIDTFTGATPIVAGPNSPGYTTVNFTLYSQNLFVKNLQMSATVYNLLNTKYYEPSSDDHLQPSIQQDGITFGIKVTYLF